MKINKPIIYCLSSAILLRIFYLITPKLDSDNAIIGLASMHILKGEFPIFFYGTPFEGIIESYIAAPLFFLFGASRFLLNLVPAFISIILIYTIYKLTKLIFDNTTGLLALIFSAISPPYFLLKTTIPMNSYIETTILGVVALLLTYKIIYKAQDLTKLYFTLGITIGFAFYLQYHIVPFAVTAAIFIYLNDKKIIFKKDFVFLILGFIIGCIPLLFYNLTHNWETFHEIGKGIGNSTFIGTLKHLFGIGYPVILGIKPDNYNQNYIPYLSSVILLIYIASGIYLILKRKPGTELLLTFLIIFPFTYWLSGRGMVNTRRYLIPLYAITPIVLAYFINGLKKINKKISYTIATIIIGYNVYTNYHTIPIFNYNVLSEYKSDMLHDRQLHKFLKENNIKSVYNNSWWTTYKLNFDFKEDIIFSYIFDEVYPKYKKSVDSAPCPAIVTYYGEFNPTLDTICASYETHIIPSPITAKPRYTINYNFRPLCQTFEEIDPINWSVNTNYNQYLSRFSFDRDISTRWHSGRSQTKDMNFILDLGKIHSGITKLIYSLWSSTDCPNGYVLYGSINGKRWRVLAKNQFFYSPIFWCGPHPFPTPINDFLEIDFHPQPVRYLKLALTTDKEIFYWSIAEIFIYRYTNKKAPDWISSLNSLEERIYQLNFKNAYADPWVISHLEKYFPYSEINKTIDRYNHIYKSFVIDTNKLKDCIFIVLEENYNSFMNLLDKMQINFCTEIFGPYRLCYNFINIKEKTMLPKEIKPDIYRWHATTIYNARRIVLSYDNSFKTSWRSRVSQEPGTFYQLDLCKRHMVSRISIYSPNQENLPQGLQIEISSDGKRWTPLKFEYNYSRLYWDRFHILTIKDNILDLAFEPVELQWIRFSQTEYNPNEWIISEIKVYGYRVRT